MKKKLLTGVLSVFLLLALSVLGIAGCGDQTQEEKTIFLNASAKELVVGESFDLTATTKPENAEVTWTSSNDNVATVTAGKVIGVSAGEATITAKNDTAEATCVITVKAAEQKYSVTFKNGDDTLSSAEVAEGDFANYNGNLPEKETTVSTVYTFAGWALSEGGEIVDITAFAIEENTTFYAIFNESVREYTVTWNIDGETIEETIAYGATPAYDGIPEKETTASTVYTFAGWALSADGEVLETIPQVNGDATYYAIFNESVREYTVTWNINGKTTEETIAYGITPAYEGTPEKPMTEDTVYTFAGWALSADGEVLEILPQVNGDATYYAIFNESVRNYTITWNINGIEEISGIAAGETPVYTGTPEKEPTVSTVYTFAGWALSEGGETVDISAITIEEDTTFYAIFNESVREYTVTWNIDGETTEETLVYGATPAYDGIPEKETTASTIYAFAGWAIAEGGEVLKTIPQVDSDATYYAIFNETTREYTITWNIDGETTEETIAYGITPAYDGTPEKETTISTVYTFAGWAIAEGGEVLETIPQVNGDATYYAIFNESAREYTITWNIDGETTEETIAYGITPVYEGTPEKETTISTVYTFAGWAIAEGGEVLETIPQVNGDATYYAIFNETTREYTITWNMDGETTEETIAYGITPVYEGTPEKADLEDYSYTFAGWALSADGEVLEALPQVDSDATYYAIFNAIFNVPEFTEGKIIYSSLSQEIFLPESLVGVSKVKIKDGESLYSEGEWAYDAITLSDEQLAGNEVITHKTVVNLSNGTKYAVDLEVYAGVIDELNDFITFFDKAPETSYRSKDHPEGMLAAQNIYGYYIVTKDLGDGTDTLTFTNQTVDTDFVRPNGFNGVLDGQGHTLKFRLMSGGLVGLIVGNATIKDLAVIFSDETSTHYGVFGYMAVGAPVIDNCYIEQINNHYSGINTYGIMAQPYGRLILRNTVVYGYNFSNEKANYWGTGKGIISAESTNAYVIHARTTTSGWTTSANFTAVFNDGIEGVEREILLSEIADASGFNEYWSKENGKLLWNSLAVTATWIKGEETIVGTFTKGSRIYPEELPENVYSETEEITYHWALTEDGEAVTFNANSKYTSDVTFYMVKVSILTGSIVLYSTATEEIFLPDDLGFNIDNSVIITDRSGDVVYYENGVWVNGFALTEAQINANEVGTLRVTITKDDTPYLATVKSYAGVIDELSDFVTLFDKAPETSYRNTNSYPGGILAAQNIYGYYIVIKDLGDGTDELTFANQTKDTDYISNNGFNGVLDGQGHTLKFKLMKGGLVGLIIGNATVKNLAIFYEDNSFVATDNGGFGVFGYMATGTFIVDNCYVERTNNLYNRASVYGLMARPYERLVLRNTLVYGFNCNMDTTWYAANNVHISASSTNAYVVCGRSNVGSFEMSKNFTKVYLDGTGEANQPRKVLAADIADASGFNAAYWDKTDGVIWKGAADSNYSVTQIAE